jgi:hypothetical protein
VLLVSVFEVQSFTARALARQHSTTQHTRARL